MATTLLEPGGDADFGTSLWSNGNVGGGVTPPAVATDFVHGTHTKSIKFNSNSVGASAVLADAGSRSSFWLYFNALPAATATIMVNVQTGFSTNIIYRLRITTAGVLQLWSNTAQIGTNGATLATGGFRRITITHTITSTTVNTIKLFVDGVLSLTVTNATLGFTAGVDFLLGNASGDGSIDFRGSDIYIDNSSANTDPGNIWVTAKRSFANGTLNGFTTQIGAGGSGYGSGHAPQVNERPLSTTNGWSMIGAGSAITEEYSIERASVGDINISGAVIVDLMGWVDAKALASETASIIVGGATSNISLTSAITIFKKIAGSTTYPAGNTDIGIITTTALTTVSLYECGIVVAFIPAIPVITQTMPSLRKRIRSRQQPSYSTYEPFYGVPVGGNTPANDVAFWKQPTNQPQRRNKRPGAAYISYEPFWSLPTGPTPANNVAFWKQAVNQFLRKRVRPRQQPEPNQPPPFPQGSQAPYVAYWKQPVNQPLRKRIRTRQQPEPNAPPPFPQTSAAPYLSYWVQPVQQFLRKRVLKRQQPKPNAPPVLPQGSEAPYLPNWVHPVNQPVVRRVKRKQPAPPSSRFVFPARPSAAPFLSYWVQPVNQPLRKRVLKRQIPQVVKAGIIVPIIKPFTIFGWIPPVQQFLRKRVLRRQMPAYTPTRGSYLPIPNPPLPFVSLVLSSGNKSETVASGNKVEIVSSGDKLSTVDSGTKDETLASGDKVTTVTSGGKETTL